MRHSCYFSSVGVLCIKEAGIQSKALAMSYTDPTWSLCSPAGPAELCSASRQGAVLRLAADRCAVSNARCHQQHCPTAAPGGQAENSPWRAWKPREREDPARLLPSLTPAARQHRLRGWHSGPSRGTRPTDTTQHQQTQAVRDRVLLLTSPALACLVLQLNVQKETKARHSDPSWAGGTASIGRGEIREGCRGNYSSICFGFGRKASYAFKSNPREKEMHLYPNNTCLVLSNAVYGGFSPSCKITRKRYPSNTRIRDRTGISSGHRDVHNHNYHPHLQQGQMENKEKNEN